MGKKYTGLAVYTAIDKILFYVEERIMCDSVIILVCNDSWCLLSSMLIIIDICLGTDNRLKWR